MSSSMRESSHVSKKTVTHGGPISGQSHSAATASSLESNLDALLEDLQTTVSKPDSRTSTLTRTVRSSSPGTSYKSAANSSKTVTENTRTISPTRGTTTTLEKFITTGPAGEPSGIPGLELLDKELQDVQPGQSKTVAYKQVSYHYDKDVDGKPMDSWAMSDNRTNKTGPALIDSFVERNFEESRTTRRNRSPEPTKSVARELLYSDNTVRSRNPSPLRSRQKDVFFQESKESYRTDPRSLTSTSQEVIEDIIPAVPASLAPGPNTKVTTTIKTYSYELPGAPESYMSSSTLAKNIDKAVSYSSPKDSTTQKTIKYEVDQKGYRSSSPVRYSPIEVPTKSKTVHAEEKYFREERHGYRPSSPTYQTSSNSTTLYRGTPSPTGTSSLRRKDKYSDINGYGPRGPGDYTDHSEIKSTTFYQSPPVPVSETRTEVIEEHYTSRSRSPPRTYYPPVQTSAKETIYKFEQQSSKNSENIRPKPFPTGGVKVYPVNKTPVNQEPPAKLEDLMASFSESEREVLHDIDRNERVQRKTKETFKKEVEFTTTTPPRSKAGSPVYYPPGSELSKRDGSGAMSQSSSAYMSDKGEWKRGMYEKESKSGAKWKTKKGKVAIPLCLPLCCAAPCVLM